MNKQFIVTIIDREDADSLRGIVNITAEDKTQAEKIVEGQLLATIAHDNECDVDDLSEDELEMYVIEAHLLCDIKGSLQAHDAVPYDMR